MLASLKATGWPLLAAALGFAGGYGVHGSVPDESPRERVVVAPAPRTPTIPGQIAGSEVTEAELSGAKAAAMSSGVVSGGEIVQPLPPY